MRVYFLEYSFHMNSSQILSYKLNSGRFHFLGIIWNFLIVMTRQFEYFHLILLLRPYFKIMSRLCGLYLFSEFSLYSSTISEFTFGPCMTIVWIFYRSHLAFQVRMSHCVWFGEMFTRKTERVRWIQFFVHFYGNIFVLVY